MLSPGRENEKRDRETKLQLYSKYGVREYWIASWQRRAIEVYRQTDEQLTHTCTLSVGDTLSSPLLPGFSVPVAQVFS